MLEHAAQQLSAEVVVQVGEVLAGSKQAVRQVDRELIVPGRHRGMGREDAPLPDDFDVVTVDRPPARLSCLLVQKLEREEAGMTLIHVETGDALMPKCLEHPYAA